MKILFVTHRLPFPPDKGDKIRAWHFLRGLAKRGHAIDVAALADDPADMDPARHAAVREIARRVAVEWRPKMRARIAAMTAVPRGLPASIPWFGSRALTRTIAGWMDAGHYDAAIAHSAPMAGYVPDVPGMTRVADFCDVDSEKWAQYAAEAGSGPARAVYAREARTMRAWERAIARGWDAVALISAAEAALFRRFCDEGRVEVVGNGVDGARFAPNAARSREEARVVFTGAMDYRPNVEGVRWFHREVWPLVRAKVPHATLAVVGPRPAESVRAIDGKDGAIVTGYVDDVREELWRARVAVAPLRIARGVQNKVLEAMATGTPVGATASAAEGIEADPGRDLLVADEPRAFADAILALLSDPDLAGRIAARGRVAALAGHSWDANVSRLEALLAPRSALQEVVA